MRVREDLVSLRSRVRVREFDKSDRCRRMEPEQQSRVGPRPPRSLPDLGERLESIGAGVPLQSIHGDRACLIDL